MLALALFTVQLVAAQDYSTAVGGLDLNTAPPGGVDPYGAATGEAGDAVSAMLAVTSGPGGGGGSAAMDKKQAFQKVRIWHEDSSSSLVLPGCLRYESTAQHDLHPAVRSHVLLLLLLQELDDFNKASARPDA